MKSTIHWVLISLTALCYISVAYFTQRNETASLLTQVSILYILLFFMWKEFRKSGDTNLSVKKIVWAAVGFRFLLLFSFPNLSDDVYRFLWDGYLVNLGWNPYLFVPDSHTSFFESNETLKFLLQEMNSKQYFSVYPPLNQWIFSISVFVGFNLFTQVLSLKLILFFVELISIIYLPKLLNKLSLNPLLSIFYLLNPLVILEGVGNLHFEVFSVAFLILFFYFLLSENLLKAFLTFALSAGIKLLPLIFLPALFRYLGFKKGLFLGTTVLVVNGLFYLPFFNLEVLENFMSSIDLYFHRFEFNASFYYLIRYFGFYYLGYNIIGVAGTFLAISSIIIILFLAIRQTRGLFNDLVYSMFLSVLIYYIFSTTVHPWYIITPLFLALICGFYRSLTLWTFLIFFSYHTYSSQVYDENLTLTFLSYSLFFIAIFFDFKQRRLNRALEKQN